MTVALMLALFLLLVVLGFPLAQAMGLSAVAAVVFEGSVPLVLFAQQFYVALDSFPLLAVPLFILAGELMNVGGVTEELVRFTRALIGHVRGGLAHANILTNMFMSAISGSAAADAAAIGAVMIPVMKRDGYRTDFVVAVTASAALMGPIIPPSIPAVIYGSITGTSIGGLLLAGAVPGVLAGLLMMILACVLAPRVGGSISPRVSAGEMLQSAVRVLPAAIMPGIIVGGIISGVFTPTEAAGVAALYSLLYGLGARKFTWGNLYRVFASTSNTTGSVLVTLGGAGLFGWVLARAGTARAAILMLTSVTESPALVLMIILGFLLVAGAVIEPVPAMIICMPVLEPIAVSLGYDPIHFGCLVLMTLVLGLVCPPAGLVALICCRIGGIEYSNVWKILTPFVILWACIILLVAFVPEIALWLPRHILKT